MNNGFVYIHRKLLDWEWYGDPVVRSVFIHLVLLANFTDKKWRGTIIKRGQVITGRKKLAQTLGFSEMQIRTVLNKLKSTNEITIKTTNKNSVITVNNYDEYQNNNQQPNQQITNKQPTNNQQITTTNKDNKDNKDNKERGGEDKNQKEKLKISDLLSLDDVYLEKYKTKFNTLSEKEIITEAEKAYHWCKSKGKVYKNYNSFLIGWLQRATSYKELQKTRISNKYTRRKGVLK